MCHVGLEVKNGPTEVSISVAVTGLQVAVSFGRSGRGPFPGSGNPDWMRGGGGTADRLAISLMGFFTVHTSPPPHLASSHLGV